MGAARNIPIRILAVVLAAMLTVPAAAQTETTGVAAPVPPSGPFDLMSSEQQRKQFQSLGDEWIGFDELSPEEQRTFAAEELEFQARNPKTGSGGRALRALFEKAASLIGRNKQLPCVEKGQRHELQEQLDAIRSEFEHLMWEAANAPSDEVAQRAREEMEALPERVKELLRGGNSKAAIDAGNKAFVSHGGAVEALRSALRAYPDGSFSGIRKTFEKVMQKAGRDLADLPLCSHSGGPGIRG